MTSLDDYLDDVGFDLSDYDLPTATGSSSYPTGSSSYDDYDFDWGDYDLGDTDDWLDDYLDSTDSSDDYSSSDSSDTFGSLSSSDDSNSSDYNSSDYGVDDFDSSDISDFQDGDLPPGFEDFAIGADYSNQKTSDHCISDVAFKQSGPRVDLAFDVIFLVLYVILFGIGLIRFLKSKQKGAAVGKWFLFPVSLFFAVLYLIISTITLILSQCVMLRYDHYQLSETAVDWFNSLSVYFLVVLILLPICLKLQQGGGKFATLTLLVHSIWLALCGIFLLVSLAIHTRIQDAQFRSHDVNKSITVDLPKARRGIFMTYYVFLFLGALMASANMVLALFRKANIRKGTLLFGIPALIISTLGLTLVLMGGWADTNYGKKDRKPSYYEKAGDAQVFLARFFYAVAFLSALVIAGSHQAIDDPASLPVAPVSKPVTEYRPPVPVSALDSPPHVA